MLNQNTKMHVNYFENSNMFFLEISPFIQM